MSVNHLKIKYQKSLWVIFSRPPDNYPWLKELNVRSYRIARVPPVKYLEIPSVKYIKCISSKILGM